jgi:hypothetical protein
MDTAMSILDRKQAYQKRKFQKKYEPLFTTGWMSPDDEEMKKPSKIQTKVWLNRKRAERD